MATLLELTSQGDVGTISDESQLSKVKLMNPQQLYELWERQPWSAHAIDLGRDAEEYATRVTQEEKESLAYNLSAFFIGEERVATQFSGLVRAYEDQGEEAFLTTQQVDEARHAQFFNRFYAEVLRRDGTFDGRLEKAREDVNDAFIQLFDVELVNAQEQLLANPGDLEAKVDFVVLYHMVIEGTLALTGQFFMQDYLEKQGKLPGLLEGYQRISQDEHRHVAYGTWFLQQKAGDPAIRRRIQAKLMELVPIATAVLVPPGVEDPYDYEILGYHSSVTHKFAFDALSRRLKVIGVPLGAEVAA
ncbi:MAG: ribonucleotide-diphosphate reductase subunit beta [Actinomycetota bacterium]|nr:ribonucleotide-diphosphate reductase subunit beta [Actinomycetota bacterium]MDQ5807808.1 ribonucleotide-diphosphate reductase subunit beta [Actinomycetota bacterium]